MPHVTVAELVVRTRALGQKIESAAQAFASAVQAVEALAGEAAALADNIEALLNDYKEDGQTLTALVPGSGDQYVGDDGTLKTGDGTT